jgi:hypothetical protein
MQIDVRVSDLARLGEVLGYDIDCVGIGSEGCPRKLPSLAEIRRASAMSRSAGKTIRLVTPKVPQRDFGDVIALLRHVIGESLVDAFTFNDLGVLDTLRQELADFPVDLGRGLIFSHDVAPGHWEDKQGEPMVLEYNVGFREKVALMRSMGVGGVEINYLPRALPGTLDFLRAHHFRRSVHLIYQLIAVARSCHVARNFALVMGNCASHCNELLGLEVSQVIHMHNQRSDQTYVEPDEFHRGLSLFVQGNVVFLKQQVVTRELFDMDVETVILNDSGLARGELGEWVIRIKGGGNSGGHEGEGAGTFVGCGPANHQSGS